MSDPSNLKKFYDCHSNFANRRLSEYDLSPGIRCKFDTIRAYLGNRKFQSALDIGCSGNALIHFLPYIAHRAFCDLALPPLIQYSSFVRYHPTCGSITQIPFKDNSFDLIVALDVLEHIPDDQTASAEIVRILNKRGLLVVTVPHRMAFFTEQDRICGHVRRYEYSQIQKLFTQYGLRELAVFPVYGQFMRLQFVQQVDPKKTEESITQLRERYHTIPLFRKLWDPVVKIGATFMRWDARFQPFHRTMDICVIFTKPRF